MLIVLLKKHATFITVEGLDGKVPAGKLTHRLLRNMLKRNCVLYLEISARGNLDQLWYWTVQLFT